MSNITFTPENDTLTAMAFIAGNLLNKLWNMERDSGEDSVETEVLKHEKISDLLNLFKEPLNLRQENFLKSALEQLSEAIDKDKTLKNVTLCEKMEKSKGILRAINGSNEEGTTEKPHDSDNVDNKEPSLENNSEVATEAITKINNVLSLINKFQKVQQNLNNLKQKSKSNSGNVKRKANKTKIPTELSLSKDEASSLNIFGTILEKITKLLMPPKKSKKMAKNIRNQNVFKNNNEIAATLKHLYNIDVDGSDLTSKDKLIFDYLSTVKRNPNCILEHLKEGKQSPITKTEGDILLNLSEFFKIKSFVDLLKLLEPENKSNVRSSNLTTTSKPETTITSERTTTKITTTTEISTKLANTKQKLKAHLKNIIDDLIEIQNAKGHPTNNISIVDALPCIYNMLNADQNVQKKSSKSKASTVSPVDKVTAIFHALKQDLMSTQTRRSNVITGERPKSAVVWERIIKNFDNKNKQSARRHLEIQEPKTFEELKNLVDKIESTSKTYKNDALMNGVPPSERLVLLKTLSEDVKQYISVLEDIDNSLFNLENIPVDKKTELKDFIDNSATNLNLNERIAKNINELKVKSNTQQESSAKIVNNLKEKYVQKHSMKLLDIKPSYERKNVKLSRDSIINQLIKNRMELFIKIKESKNVDLESDMNYSIAKKILAYLESGNYTIARELYKIIVSQKQKTNDQPPADKKTVLTSGRRSSILTKEPVVQFEGPRGQSQLQWLNQDIWLKQLTNLKNMRL
ncbi:uncharacterized protein LOC135083098 [Ostrinia nubilalis]|uniref:uncharacterized protein LOC135083098 n=1 Tax=Ostrinia nubilalis TaxID=29057 RepID=UPI003082551E